MNHNPHSLPVTRRHDIDVLRVGAFALLILYHVGMLYVAEWSWHLKSTHTTEWLQLPMVALNRWRMPLLFLLSGIAVGLFRPERGPWRFGVSRTIRLLVPLVFAMFTTITIQAYCQGVTNGLVEPGFGRFFVRYWQVEPFPEGAFDGWKTGITWNHLWYLAYLWTYTMVLLALLPLLRSSVGQRVARFASDRKRLALLWPAIPLFIYFHWLAPRFRPTNGLIDGDWFQHALYFTVFLCGYWLARSERFWQEVGVRRGLLTGVALSTGTAYLLIIAFAPDESPLAVLVIARALRACYLWSTLLTILAWGVTTLNRPFKWLPYASEAVYPWYILHQTWIVLLAYWLVPLKLPAAIEVSAVVLGTIAGCALAHEFVIRRSALLRPLFGLKPTPPSPGSTVTAAAGNQEFRGDAGNAG